MKQKLSCVRACADVHRCFCICRAEVYQEAKNYPEETDRWEDDIYQEEEAGGEPIGGRGHAYVAHPCSVWTRPGSHMSCK